MPKLIIFVCVSNVCRSPMMEYLFQQQIQSSDKINYVIESRSLSTDYEPEGSSASPQGIEVMKSYGINMDSHRSKLFSGK